MGHDGFSGGGSEDLVPQADQAAGGDAEFHVLQVAFGFHDLEHALAHHDQFGGLACGGFWHVDDEMLERLVLHAVDVLEQDLRLADLQLVPLTAHGFNQHAQVKDASTVDVPPVFAVGGFYPEGQVLLELGVEALADVTAREELSVFPEEWGRVDREEQAHGGLVHGDAFHGLRLFEVGHGVANLKPVHAGDGAQVAAADMLDLLFAQA